MSPSKIIRQASFMYRPKKSLRLWLWWAFDYQNSLTSTKKSVDLLESVENSEKLLVTGKLSDEYCQNLPMPSHVPKGFLAVYVGAEQRRFVIPMSCLSMPEFKDLMDQAAEEYGFEHQGGLHIPCEADDFEDILLRCLEMQHGNKNKFNKLLKETM